MTKPSKDVTYYLNLPYTIRLRRDDVGDVVARIEELPGCISHGSDQGEALSNLRDMQALWLKTALRRDNPYRNRKPTSLFLVASGCSAYPEACTAVWFKWPKLRA